MITLTIPEKVSIPPPRIQKASSGTSNASAITTTPATIMPIEIQRK
jgi:hypothetical protein